MSQKINFHYFIKHDNSRNYISNLIDILDNSGYTSILFPFDGMYHDYLIRVANVAKPTNKLKYMFAIRPYAMHPGYLAMMTESFQEIVGDKMIINLVPGTKPNSMFDVFDTLEKRREACGKFTEKYINILKSTRFSIKTKLPEIFFSGSNNPTPENVYKYGDGIIVKMENITKYANIKEIVKNKKICVAVWIIKEDNMQLAKEKYDKVTNASKPGTIYGDVDSLILQIDELYKMGVTDLMIMNNTGYGFPDVHDLVIEYNKRRNYV